MRPGRSCSTASVASREKLLHRLSCIPDVRLVHHLLRSCADACRFNHLLRGADCSPYEDLLAKADDRLFDVFGDLFGTTLPPTVRRQVSMPLRLGGCGVKTPGSRHHTARIAAVASYVTSGWARVGAPDYVLDVVVSALLHLLLGLQDHLGAAFDPVSTWVADPARIKAATDDHCSQQWWTDAWYRQTRQNLLSLLPNREQARLLELADGLGHSWMSILPSRQLGSIISADDYGLGLRWHLGLDVLPGPASCPGCGRAVDAKGDHFLLCPRNYFATRHNAVQDSIYSVLSSNGESLAKEVPLVHRTDAQLRPADLLLRGW